MSPEPIYRSIGAIIRARRRQREWSQENLAQRLRISRTTLASIETGRQRILVHQLYDFAVALGLKLEDLLPRVSAGSAGKTWADLPMPVSLNSVQKEQLARLIQAADVPATPIEERPVEKSKTLD